jgi:signal peptidase II
MTNWKKWAVFAAVVLVTTGLDLGTKKWAASNLANPEHALPLIVGADDAGKSVELFLAGNNLSGVGPGDVIPLSAPIKAEADGDYPVERVGLDRGYFVFEDADRKATPLHLYNPALKEFYDKRAAGETVGADWRAGWKDRKVKWTTLLTENLPTVDDEEAAAALTEGRVHPIPIQTVHPPGAMELKEGDVLMVMTRSIDVIPGFYRLIYAENPGAAWGFLRDAPLLVRIFFLQIVSLFAMGLIVVVVWKTPTGFMPSVIGLALIMGGAVGNFVDRFLRTVVVDFLDMFIRDSHWPTYNVADIGITVGVVLLLIQVLRKKSPF